MPNPSLERTPPRREIMIEVLGGAAQLEAVRHPVASGLHAVDPSGVQMLSSDIVRNVHNAVCAIGILPVPLTEWRLDPQLRPLQVRGSGFLVRATTVMTNKHVLENAIAEAKEFEIPESQLFVSFIAPSRLPGPLGTVRMIRRSHIPEEGRIDIALLEIRSEPETHFEDIVPLPVAASFALEVSEEVFICGYPYGNMLLQPQGRPFRFGPIIQQGFVSGLSPFAGTEAPEEILLDVRTANKMSGSPVVRSHTGEVIGIHYEGAIDAKGITTTSFAIPIDHNRVSSWLAAFDELLRDA